MNVSSEAPAFPINHHRRLLTNTHKPMLVSASPIAVNNKIRAIQTRKPRITLQSYYDYTDIRPLNLGNGSGVTNLGNISPEKLVERSKELRLGRISARPNPRSSVLSTTSITNQQSLLWSNLHSPMGFAKQPQINSPTVSPTALAPPLYKSSTGNIPDIQQRLSRIQNSTRQPSIEQQILPTPVEPRHKSLPKTKASIPKAYHRTVPKSKSPYPISHAQPLQILPNDYSKQSTRNIIRLCESEDDENVPIMDEEFEEYLQKALVKCADWLMKYVFDQKYDENTG
jgi:hypothetical protein